MPHISYREESRKNYGEIKLDCAAKPSMSLDQLKVGALLRIADATELMAKDRAVLLADVAFYKERYDSLRVQNAKLRKSNAGLRGYINSCKVSKP